MLKFHLKVVFAVSTFFLLTLGGMNIAQQGMKEMRGQTISTESVPVGIIKDDSGRMEANFLGGKFQTTIEAKMLKLDERKNWNFFSSLGEEIGKALKTGLRAIVE